MHEKNIKRNAYTDEHKDYIHRCKVMKKVGDRGIDDPPVLDEVSDVDAKTGQWTLISMLLGLIGVFRVLLYESVSEEVIIR